MDNENAFKAYAERPESPISDNGEHEPAAVENRPQDGSEFDTREDRVSVDHDGNITIYRVPDTREQLEADIMASNYPFVHTPAGFRDIKSWLNRQAAITEHEIYKREQFHEKTQDMVEQIETQGIEIDGLIAERDGLRRALETQEHLAGQASRDYLRVLDHADELQERLDSLTAERDELRDRLKIQANSFQKLERDNAKMRDTLARVRELAGDA